MKLYLSSYRMGDHFDELWRLAGPNAKVGLISNALDYIPAEARRAFARKNFDPLSFFQANGFDAADLDLREYFGRADSLKQALREFQIVWAVGGNAFLLLRAMHASGFHQCIGPLVASDHLIYGGWSAGVVVAARSLRGIELMDDPTIKVDGYPTGEQPWDGLGLIDFLIVPHFQSDHPEAPAGEKTAAYMVANNIRHQTLRDGEVIIIRDQNIEILPAGS